MTATACSNIPARATTATGRCPRSARRTGGTRSTSATRTPSPTRWPTAPAKCSANSRASSATPTTPGSSPKRPRKLRAAYAPTFLNPATGVLAGWKSADGQLHDYWFTFVQGVAITYGLLDDKTANAVMDRLLAKMQAVGYTNFALGLPGNLVPVRKGDYVYEDYAAGADRRAAARRRQRRLPVLRERRRDRLLGLLHGQGTLSARPRRRRAADFPPDARRLRPRRVPGLRRQRHVARLARLERRLPRLRRSAGGQLPHAAGGARRRENTTACRKPQNESLIKPPDFDACSDACRKRSTSNNLGRKRHRGLETSCLRVPRTQPFLTRCSARL